MRRKICVLVTARPSYSRIKSALRAIAQHPDLELQLVVAASALLDRYGSAIQSIEHDGFDVNARVYMVLEGENLVTSAKSTGLGLVELATVFDTSVARARGFAAQTDRGLVVPVVRDANRMTLVELADELARLTELARHGRLGPEHLTSGTFTLNNYGVFGVDGSTPIINHPEAALLGVGRIVDKPWVVDGALAVRKVTQLSLTFDHRVCDGGVAGGFLRYVADAVERPVILLGAL